MAPSRAWSRRRPKLARWRGPPVSLMLPASCGTPPPLTGCLEAAQAPAAHAARGAVGAWWWRWLVEEEEVVMMVEFVAVVLAAAAAAAGGTAPVGRAGVVAHVGDGGGQLGRHRDGLPLREGGDLPRALLLGHLDHPLPDAHHALAVPARGQRMCGRRSALCRGGSEATEWSARRRPSSRCPERSGRPGPVRTPRQMPTPD